LTAGYAVRNDQPSANEDAMERFDFVIIGAGPAGEAAAHLARGRRASVAIVDRDLFGGSCPHWGCIPSKSLLNAAAHHAEGGNYSWERASARRDYMINRVNRDYPDDSGHVRDLESAGRITLARFRDLLGVSRKTAQMLLERFDADGVTRRQGDERVLRRRGLRR